MELTIGRRGHACRQLSGYERNISMEDVKMRKKLEYLVLCLIISIGLVACSGSEGSRSPNISEISPTPTNSPSYSTAPSVPAALTATASSSSSVVLNWTASSDDVGVTGYEIFRNGVQISTLSTMTFNDTGLTSNTTYTYTVSAYDAAGNSSAKSASVSVTTLASGTIADTQAPTAPTNLIATAASSAEMNLSWTASTDDAGVTGYKIFRNGTQISTSITNTFNDTGLTSGNAYTYVISAYDGAGNNSALSLATSTTTMSGPAASCTNPTPVLGTFSPAAPGYIILFRNGINAQDETNRLAGLYKFQPTHIYQSIGGFSATFSTDVLEHLRCEANIKSIEFDGVAYAQ